MLGRYARRIRRRSLLDLKGGPFLDREKAIVLLVLSLSVLIPQALGATPRIALIFVLVAALPCLAWPGFVLWHWGAVMHRYGDRTYHLVTKKRLSREYRDQPSP